MISLSTKKFAIEEGLADAAIKALLKSRGMMVDGPVKSQGTKSQPQAGGANRGPGSIIMRPEMILRVLSELTMIEYHDEVV